MSALEYVRTRSVLNSRTSCSRCSGLALRQLAPIAIRVVCAKSKWGRIFASTRLAILFGFPAWLSLSWRIAASTSSEMVLTSASGARSSAEEAGAARASTRAAVLRVLRMGCKSFRWSISSEYGGRRACAWAADNVVSGACFQRRLRRFFPVVAEPPEKWSADQSAGHQQDRRQVQPAFEKSAPQSAHDRSPLEFRITRARARHREHDDVRGAYFVHRCVRYRGRLGFGRAAFF